MSLGLSRWPNWQHGALIGHAVRTYRTIGQVRSCPSASDRAKELARKIEELSRDLEWELRTNRVTPPKDAAP
jgi:hypothetical protein